MKSLASILFAAFCAFPGGTLAQQACQPAGYKVAFFNGVWNSYIDAWTSMAELRKRFTPSLSQGPVYTRNGQEVTHTVFYNKSDGTLEDIAEVFKQLEQSHPELAGRYDFLVSQIVGGTSLPLWVLGRPAQQAVQDGLIEYAKGAMARAAPQAEVDVMVARMRRYEENKLKVLAVAHSQGNLFLNSVYRAVPNLGRDRLNVFRTVRVAPPAPIEPPADPFTTNTRDSVINVIRALTNNLAPPGNVTDFLVEGLDPVGHKFIGTYLRPDTQSVDKIRTDFFLQLDALSEYECVPAAVFELYLQLLRLDTFQEIENHICTSRSGVFLGEPWQIQTCDAGAELRLRGIDPLCELDPQGNCATRYTYRVAQCELKFNRLNGQEDLILYPAVAGGSNPVPPSRDGSIYRALLVPQVVNFVVPPCVGATCSRLFADAVVSNTFSCSVDIFSANSDVPVQRAVLLRTFP